MNNAIIITLLIITITFTVHSCLLTVQQHFGGKKYHFHFSRVPLALWPEFVEKENLNRFAWESVSWFHYFCTEQHLLLLKSNKLKIAHSSFKQQHFPCASIPAFHRHGHKCSHPKSNKFPGRTLFTHARSHPRGNIQVFTGGRNADARGCVWGPHRAAVWHRVLVNEILTGCCYLIKPSAILIRQPNPLPSPISSPLKGNHRV